MASGIQLDFEKLPADQHVSVWIGPANAIANVAQPTANEINAMAQASQSISWNDWDFGMQASESTNEPSLADVSNYSDFGAVNYGGSMSLYYPKNYDDPSNPHSNLYDLTDTPGTRIFIAVRIDGEKKTSTPAADGDYISVYLAQTDSETNSLTGADALRRTIGLLQQSVFAHNTVVGSHVLTPTPATVTATVGEVGRLSVTVQGRAYTNACSYLTSDPAVVLVSPGGVWSAVGAGTATVTVYEAGNPDATDGTVTFTVS